MPYANADDLALSLPRGEQELIELTDTTQSGVPDDDKLDAALAYADDTINSYLRGRYAVPVVPSPRLLRDLACDIARHRLYGDAPTETVQKRLDAAVSRLKDLSAGRATLPGAAGDAAELPVAGRPIRAGQGKSNFDWSAHRG